MSKQEKARLQNPIAIPEPTNDVDALWRTCQALKEAVEVMQGARGNREVALKADLTDLSDQIITTVVSAPGGGGGSTTFFDLTDTNLTGQGIGDLVFNLDATNWYPTGSNLRWYPSSAIAGDAAASIRLGSNVTIDFEGTTNITGARYSSDNVGTFYVVGSPATTMLRSIDGPLNWEKVTVTTNASYLRDIAYGPTIGANGRLVAVGNASSGTYSDDYGATWSNFTLPVQEMGCIAWSPFYNVFAAGGVNGHIYTSSDGLNWTERFTAENNPIQDIKWSEWDFLFIAVAADSSTSIIITSTDSVNWAHNLDSDLSSLFTPDSPNCIAETNNGIYVVPSSNPSITPRHVYSTNPTGLSWTIAPDDPRPLYDLTHSASLGKWVGSASNSSSIFVSGSTHTAAFTAFDTFNSFGGSWRIVHWSDEYAQFIAVGSGSIRHIMVSSDGTTWDYDTPQWPGTTNSSTWLQMREFSLPGSPTLRVGPEAWSGGNPVSSGPLQLRGSVQYHAIYNTTSDVFEDIAQWRAVDSTQHISPLELIDNTSAYRQAGFSTMKDIVVNTNNYTANPDVWHSRLYVTYTGGTCFITFDDDDHLTVEPGAVCWITVGAGGQVTLQTLQMTITKFLGQTPTTGNVTMPEGSWATVLFVDNSNLHVTGVGIT